MWSTCNMANSLRTLVFFLFSLHVFEKRERESRRRLNVVYFMLAKLFPDHTNDDYIEYLLMTLNNSKCLNVLSHVIFMPVLWERYYNYPCFIYSKSQRLGYSPKSNAGLPGSKVNVLGSFIFYFPNQICLFFNHESPWLFLFVCFCYFQPLALDQEKYSLRKYRQA